MPGRPPCQHTHLGCQVWGWGRGGRRRGSIGGGAVLGLGSIGFMRKCWSQVLHSLWYCSSQYPPNLQLTVYHGGDGSSEWTQLV